MKDFLKAIKEQILIYDGSKGYLLQKLGLKGGECGELWNLTNREAVTEVYKQYIEAGSDVIQTNTFPGNRVHLEKYSLADKTYDINYWGARLAREAAGDNILVAASIGPTGVLFEPSGELTFEKAYDVFKEQVIAVADGGVDLINFETFTDLAEMRAALLAAKENTDLPVICSMAYEAGGHTLMGNTPDICVSVLLSLGADMVGTNCSFGAGHMLEIVKKMHEVGGGYLSIKPNAGLPEVKDGKVCYKETAESFAAQVVEFAKYGARLVGGCCGTTPEYIKAIKNAFNAMDTIPLPKRTSGIITSGVKQISILEMKNETIGRLDTTSDEELLSSLEKGDLTAVEDRALDMATEDWDAVLVNVELAVGDDGLLASVINTAQSYIKAPIIIQSRNAIELDKALRVYKGIAGVKLDEADNKAKLLSVVKKYGSEIVN